MAMQNFSNSLIIANLFSQEKNIKNTHIT